MTAAIRIEGLVKSFTLHNQGGVRLSVLAGFELAVEAGECVALRGPSGIGKSTVLRCIYGNYRADGGRILVRHRGGTVDMAAAHPRKILAVRNDTVGYVSQFLRVIPRVAAEDVVAEPLRNRGADPREARQAARGILQSLNIPAALHRLAPATFSGGEQQRVNLARVFVADYPVLLLDEPTASLDRENRDAAIGLIREAVRRGAAIVGIFHDSEVRDAVATRTVPLSAAREAA